MPLDGLLQPRVGSLHAGVSRQAPLLRSPSQMEEVINYLPSVDLGGLVDRVGATVIATLTGGIYSNSGHFMFRTTDGQRWAFLRRMETGGVEVRNLTNGALASLTVGPYVQNYIGNETALRFLTIDDTVLIMNPHVTVAWTDSPAYVLNRAYIVIKKLSTAKQTFYVNGSTGSASIVYDGTKTTQTRDYVAQQLQALMGTQMPGLGISRINNVLRVQGDPSLIAAITAGNDWDDTAMTLIKGSVSATADLPSTFYHGEPIKVDLGNGDTKSAYWVTYDQASNAYKETTWLDAFATSGSLNQATMPIRLHQTGTNSFELQPVDWTPRKVGDDDSNPAPEFVGDTLTDMALWKGRLWLASPAWVQSSQPDDLFNFWSGSARESLADDPVKLQAEADLGNIVSLSSFRDSLMVFTENAQCSVDGSQAVKPDTASLGVNTRYDVDPLCAPDVIGDALYYSGTQEGRSVLWEYKYEEQTANNTATDLSKHVPRYCPGTIRRIDGSAQAGRVFIWSALDPATLYVQTSYWQDQQRKQNAWCKLAVTSMTSIAHHWVDKGNLYLLGTVGTNLMLLSTAVDGNLGENPTTDIRLDLRQTVQVTWNVTRNRSEVVIPVGMSAIPGLVVAWPNDTGWFNEYPITVIYDGSQWIGYFPEQVDTARQCLIGVRMSRSFTFSPFYPTVGDAQTPMGRLQVHKVFLDCLRAGDFTATVKRADRPPMTVQLSPRVVGAALVPVDGDNTQYGIPFNAQGHKASLTVSTTSTAPMIVTGYTLAARYTNLFQSS